MTLNGTVSRRSLAGLSALIVLLALALLPTSASALNTRAPTAFSPIDGTSTGAAFGVEDAPQALAIDEATGNLFVGTRGSEETEGEVRIFNAEGGVPVGVATPYKITGLGGVYGIAIDNSPTSPSKGAIYVLELLLIEGNNHPKVTKFTLNPDTESYEAVGELVGTPTIPQIKSIAVDSHGNVYLSSRDSNGGHPEAVEFDPTGSEIDRTPASPFGNFLTEDLALDGAGNLFVQSETSNTIYRYSTGSSEEAAFESFTDLILPLPRGLDTDFASNTLFVATDDHVVQYDTESGAKGIEYGSEFLTFNLLGGIAVNSASDRVYVLNSTINFSKREIVVFGSEVPLATIAVDQTTTSGAATKATLNASVDPEDVAVEECSFEWGTAAGTYPNVEPCEGAIPTDSDPHPVHLELEGLIPQGHAYHFRVKVKNANGTNTTKDQTFLTADVFATGEATPGPAGATVNGSVRPEGSPLTECEFEYGTTTSYGSSAPCSPGFAEIPGDTGKHSVSAVLGGLEVNTTYHYRIAASGGLGSFKGSDRTFTTLGPPLIAEETAGSIESTTATLFTQVNPRGFDSAFHYEYGTAAGAYDHRFPAGADLAAGSGTAAVKDSAPLSGLAENTTYHYRVVATNGVGATNGPDQTFTTAHADASCPNAAIRAEQGVEARALPDCRAIEQVSPPHKSNQFAKKPQVSANGERVQFFSIAALGGSPGSLDYSEGDPYVATRGPGGWNTAPTVPPPPLIRGWNLTAVAKSFTPDFSAWLQIATDEQGAQVGEGRAYRAGLGGTFEALSPPLAPVGDPKQADIEDAEFQAASADHSHLYFSPRALSQTAGAAYLPGDPEPGGPGSGPTTYLARLDSDGQPSLELLARDRDGKAWGGRCGASVGGNTQSAGAINGPNQGAVSPDGSRTYFSTRAAQPEAGPCDSANKRRILVRTETEGGPEIEELFAAECDRLAPACDPADGDDLYQGASVDQGKVYFLTSRQLADSDLDSGTECSATIGASVGCDLYLYDSSLPAGQRLVQVSAGGQGDPTPGQGADVLGVTGISGDGSHVYFVATGVLTDTPNTVGSRAEPDAPNLYLYQRDAAHPAGRTVFVGRLVPADTGNEGPLWGGGAVTWQNGAYPVPVAGSDADGHEIGGDGHILIFATKAALSGEDVDDVRRDAYRYDADTDALQCISCRPGGGSGAAIDLVPGRRGGAAGTDFAEIGRWASEDGKTVVFTTREGLLANDDNDMLDSYLWRDGRLVRLPGTADVGSGASALFSIPALSHDGSTVAFTSYEQLVPSDGDSAIDTYVARAGGGYPVPVPPVPCQGEGCQEPFSARPADQGAASEGTTAGNVAEPQPRCRKGFVRRRGNCVRQRHGRKHKKQHERHRERAGDEKRRAGK